MFQVLQLGGDNHGVDVAVGRVDGGKIRQVPRYETRHMGNRDMTFLDQKRSDRSPHQYWYYYCTWTCVPEMSHMIFGLIASLFCFARVVVCTSFIMNIPQSKRTILKQK